MIKFNKLIEIDTDPTPENRGCYVKGSIKKYLFIIDTVKQGGAENILLRFSTYLQKKKIDYKIFALFGRESENVIPGEFKRNANNFLLKFIQQQILKFRFKRLKRSFKPDIVFSFLERSNIIALDTADKNEKIIISVHNNLEEQYKKFGTIKQALIRFIINTKYNGKAWKIIAVSQNIKENLIDWFGIKKEKIIVINNSVDQKKVQIMAGDRIEKIAKKDLFRLITIGRVEYQKAQWKLLKAVYYLKQVKGINNIELMVLGDGEYLDALKNLAKKLSIETRIHFMGFVANPFPYLKNSDLLVLPSIYEGFPVTVSEAIVLRVGFIGSRKAIPKEVFQTRIEWEDCTYSNINTMPDFTDKVLEDDITLSELILKGLNRRENIIRGTATWMAANSEKTNFDNYLSL